MLPAVRIQKKSILLIHTSHIQSHGVPYHMTQDEGQRAIYPSAKQSMDHDLVAPCTVFKMLHHYGPVIRQSFCGLNLTLYKAERIGRRGLV